MSDTMDNTEEIAQRIQELQENGVDEKWWNSIDKTREDYRELYEKITTIDEVKEFKHNLWMNEILLGLTEWSDELESVVRDNDLVVGELNREERRMNTEKGEFEVRILTTKWLGGEFDTISDNKVNRYWESFVTNELELFPYVDESFVNEEGDFVVEYNEKLNSTRSLREVTSTFNINFIKSFSENRIVFDGSNPFLFANKVVTYKMFKNKSFVEHFVLNEVGVSYEGHRFYEKETNLEFEDNKMNFTRILSATFEDEEGETKSMELDAGDWIWDLFLYTRNLNVPFFDLDDVFDTYPYEEVYEEAVSEAVRITRPEYR